MLKYLKNIKGGSPLEIILVLHIAVAIFLVLITFFNISGLFQSNIDVSNQEIKVEQNLIVK